MFQKGNKFGKGRPRVPEIEQFRQALAEVAKEKKLSLIKHCVRQAYEDNTMAAQILKKILPDLQSIQGDLTGDITVEIVDKFGDKHSDGTGGSKANNQDTA